MTADDANTALVRAALKVAAHLAVCAVRSHEVAQEPDLLNHEAFWLGVFSGTRAVLDTPTEGA